MWDRMSRVVTLLLLGAGRWPAVEIRELLEGRLPAIETIKLMDSAEHVGEMVAVRDEAAVITPIDRDAFGRERMVLSALDPEESLELIPDAVRAGSIWIDAAGALSRNPAVPLVITRLNGATIREEHRVLSLPGPLATMAATVLLPLHREWALRRVTITAVQGHSARGKEQMDTLLDQSRHVLAFHELDLERDGVRLAFNAFPDADESGEEGMTLEEQRCAGELARILEIEEHAVEVHLLWVPIFAGCGASIAFELEREPDWTRLPALLGEQDAIQLCTGRGAGRRMSTFEQMGRDRLSVGRIRRDRRTGRSGSLWIAGDDMRFGLALNAIELCELLSNRGS
jgi:aspartate-semialdehyde dehydrogenase